MILLYPVSRSDTVDPVVRLSVTAEGAMYAPAQQSRLLEVARAADQLGVDFIDTTEHVLMGLNALSSNQGWELHHLDQPQPEALVTLAAMAGATSRIGILSSIVIAPLRPAGLLAKQVASLYALSRGRFVLGVTTSWQKDEYDALGVPFELRGQLLTETIGACRALWTQAPASFHSRFVNFDGMFCSPRPAAGERIPVWFGGRISPRQLRRIVGGPRPPSPLRGRARRRACHVGAGSEAVRAAPRTTRLTQVRGAWRLTRDLAGAA
jgi:alkanesulfonate monooxygenase SsuD/methylene tetrahydromethanopterin reductase-like flavin-dependent oxidoreductase (luciferase family)